MGALPQPVALGSLFSTIASSVVTLVVHQKGLTFRAAHSASHEPIKMQRGRGGGGRMQGQGRAPPPLGMY